MLRLVLLSDTHGLHDQIVVPDGDILIHAGDLTSRGKTYELESFADWCRKLPHRHKVIIGGNHDFCLENNAWEARTKLHGLTYLEDSGCEIGGLKFWGSPQTPRFFDWAFNVDRGPQIRRYWDRIPAETDVLITHGPPLGRGDLTKAGERAGCADLLAAIQRIQPRLHVAGHIHEGYSQSREGATLCVNASICTLAYRPTNQPVVLDL